MKLRRNIKFFLFLLSFLFLFKNPVFSAENSFVTIVNPVRGSEFAGEDGTDPLFWVKYQEGLLKKFNLPATWLLRFDIVRSSTAARFFKEVTSKNELGLFLEVTPNLAKIANVNYPSGGIYWHDANKIFLSGYIPEQRIKIIDAAFREFQKTFGFFPKSVGAWHVDAFSAQYMRKEYGVTGILICADQFATDRYQIWGGWWGVPYYPSRFNILTPAQTNKNKIDAVVFWWAARDPELGYGASVFESTYSVQANDYGIHHGKDIAYFNELLNRYLDTDKTGNQFGQVTIGLENDNDWEKVGDRFEQQLNLLKQKQENGEIKTTTMAEFSIWYRAKFKLLSPEQKIGGWIMSSQFRAGIYEKEGRFFLRDLRVYNENWPEANLLTANVWESLSLNNPYKIDTLRFPESQKQLPENFNLKEEINNYGSQKIPFSFNRAYLYLYLFLVFLTLAIVLKRNFLLTSLIALGSTSWSATMVKSGLVYPYGMGFWGPNGHDGIWHLSLINSLANFSLQNPVFSGFKLTNYHFGFDLILALIHKISGIPSINLYFQIIPPLIAVLIGYLTYKLILKWTGSDKKAFWAVFFVYFSGSWGWLIDLLRNFRAGGESLFWANQAVSTLINPPYALSLIFLLSGLLKLFDVLSSGKKKDFILTAIFLGILIQIKVYAGVIVLGSLGLTAFLSFFFWPKKKQIWTALFGSTLAISLCLFLPFNSKSAALLVFSPLWFSQTMIAFSDRFYWPKLDSARISYFQGHVWIKWLAAETLALLIFVFGNLGTRITALLNLSKSTALKKEHGWNFIWLSLLSFSFLIPLLFIQKGNPWNTIQFFYYFQFFLAIFAGIWLGGMEKKTFLTIIIVILTIPTTVGTLMNSYLPKRPPSRISVEELEALNFLRNQKNGVVLSYPFNESWRNKFSEPKPLYAYETTGYIAALGEKPVFLEDEMNLEISGYQWKKRREESISFFSTDKKDFAEDFLRKNNIKYLYLVKGQALAISENDIAAEKIFENGEVKIYSLSYN